MTPTAAALGADVRATPTEWPRLRDCLGGYSAGSRKKNDMRQEYGSQFRFKLPSRPSAEHGIVIEARPKNCVSVDTVDKNRSPRWADSLEDSVREGEIYAVARLRP